MDRGIGSAEAEEGLAVVYLECCSHGVVLGWGRFVQKRSYEKINESSIFFLLNIGVKYGTCQPPIGRLYGGIPCHELVVERSENYLPE